MPDRQDHTPVDRQTLDTVVPDQREKLRYLIYVKGDQRDKDHRRPGYVLDDGSGDFLCLDVVEKQSDLANALGVSASTVNRWMANKSNIRPRRIPSKFRTKICKIYRISERSFNTANFDKFDTPPDDGPINWHTIVTQAARQGRILDKEPIFPTRYARLDSIKDLPEVTCVVVNSPFWFEFVSPKDQDKRPLWKNWHILLFNHDISAAGFMCYLPRFRNNVAFGSDTFPARGDRLILPRTPILRHGREDIGRQFEMVLAVCKEPLPSSILTALCRDAHGVALERDLQELAGWIGGFLQQDLAAIVKVPYLVVEKR